MLNQITNQATKTPDNNPQNTLNSQTLDPLGEEWMRFMEIFSEVKEPIKMFSESSLENIERGATPIEALLLQLYTTLHQKYSLQQTKIDEMTANEKRRTKYPGSLLNRHPAPETDPFIEGIKNI